MENSVFIIIITFLIYMKIYKNEKLIWDSETRPKYTTADPFTWLECTLTEEIKKREEFVLPECNYERNRIDYALETYKIKIDLLQQLQDFINNNSYFYDNENDIIQFAINTDPYNHFSRGDLYEIKK